MIKKIVVNNFYSDPDKIRNLAINTQFNNVENLNYPGFQSKKSYASSSIKDSFSRLLNKNIKVDHSCHTFGYFRFMLKSTGSVLKVHVDGAADWTGLIYLNHPEQCNGGTNFYQHKRTGLSQIPNGEELTSRGYSSQYNFYKEEIEPDAYDPNAWDIIDCVEMKYNRLVLFEGNKNFHCHTNSFGDSFHDGRLTQNFFFNTKEH